MLNIVSVLVIKYAAEIKSKVVIKSDFYVGIVAMLEL